MRARHRQRVSPGYLEGFLHKATGRYFAVPGQSRFRDPDDPKNMEPIASLEFAAVGKCRQDRAQ
jgi:hypothetical protein